MRRDAFDAEADALAREWLSEEEDPAEDRRIASDDDESPVARLGDAPRDRAMEARAPGALSRAISRRSRRPATGFIQVARGGAVSLRIRADGAP
jgi:hypothetical protein